MNVIDFMNLAGRAGFEPATFGLLEDIINHWLDALTSELPPHNVERILGFEPNSSKLVQVVGLEPTRIVWLKARCPSSMASLAWLIDRTFILYFLSVILFSFWLNGVWN